MAASSGGERARTLRGIRICLGVIPVAIAWRLTRRLERTTLDVR
ncbi:hypothetical protein [Microbacterium sp. NPDC056052]